MQTTLEKSTALGRRLTVAVPEERIAEAVQSRLDNLRQNARIDGFRQGKAPMSVVRRQFGARVREEVVGELLQRSFAEAMDKEALRPAGQPTIEPVSARPGEGLTYIASFEVFPDIALAPVEQLELTRPQCEIVDQDIDRMIERLREQHREWLAVERPARDGDQVNIDFVGTIDGEPFEGGTGEGFDVVLGTGSMIEGFEDGLRGRSAGESVELDLRFPEAYRNTDLAGKPVRFAINVKRVAEPLLPALDVAFMEKFGIRDGDLVTFRGEVRANIEKERDRALRQRFHGEVMDKLGAANDFDLPTALVDGEAQRLRQQVARDLIMRGINPGDAVQQFEDTVRSRARERVKLGLVMAEIVKQGQLRADATKVRQMIDSLASSYEDPAAVVKWYYENPEQLQQVEAMCLEQEAVEWIASRARVTDQGVSFDALMNPVQTDGEA